MYLLYAFYVLITNNYIMNNIKDNCSSNVTVIGRTYRGDESTLLVIPNELAKNLQIENSKVSLLLLNDFDGNKHLVVTKFQKEIVIE